MATVRGLKKRYLRYRSRVAPTREVALPGAEGRILVDLRDERGLRIATWGAGHLQERAWWAWRRLLSLDAWDIVIDVGANYGEFSVPAARRHGDHVLAVEPNPAVVALLVQSVGRVAATSVVASCAAGSTSGGAWLRRGTSSGRGEIADTPAGGDALLVGVATLDELAVGAVGDGARLRRVLVKIDVEGTEADVLAGATSLLGDADVAVILTETVHSGFGRLRDALPGFTAYGLLDEGGSPVRLRSDGCVPDGRADTRDVIFARGVDLQSAG